MCKNLDFDALLVFVLVLAKEERVSFRAFRMWCEHLQDKHKNYIVSLDSESINLALEWYPSLFYKEDSFFIRTKTLEDYRESDYIKNEFFSRLPEEVTKIKILSFTSV